MAELLYGVRRAAPLHTVVEAESRDEAVDVLLPGDVVVVSKDGGRTWSEDSVGEIKPMGVCRECGRDIRLTKNELMWHHSPQARDTFGHPIYRCAGAGKPPLRVYERTVSDG